MMEIGFKFNEENIIKTLETDYLNRNRYLNGLINILNNVNDSKIIALDGDWGSGKTWFLKSLEYLMTCKNEKKYINIDNDMLKKLKEEYMVFYYNAWENDDAPSAMISLLYKIINDTYINSEKEVTKTALKIFNNIIKYATAGVVDIQQDFFGEEWDSKNLTDSIQTSEEIKKDFKEAIKELLAENKNKMLIIIDEIDRCKPTFAIDLLENIKHFYDDERIEFIVGTNNRQLSSLVQKVYGDKYDGTTYLDKFFDINLELPNNYMETYIDRILKGTTLDRNNYINYYNEIAKYYHLTMREYNRYINSLNLLKNSIDEIDGFPYYIPLAIKFIFIPIALCLKIINKDKYYSFISGNQFEEILPLINKNKLFIPLPRQICLNKDDHIFDDIEKLDITKEDKSQKIKDKSIQILKEIYTDLFVNCLNDTEKYDYKENLIKIFDVISMMK